MRGRVEGRADLFQPTQFPRSAKYDRDWARKHDGAECPLVDGVLAEHMTCHSPTGFFDAMISVGLSLLRDG